MDFKNFKCSGKEFVSRFWFFEFPLNAISEKKILDAIGKDQTYEMLIIIERWTCKLSPVIPSDNRSDQQGIKLPPTN